MQTNVNQKTQIQEPNTVIVGQIPFSFKRPWKSKTMLIDIMEDDYDAMRQHEMENEERQMCEHFDNQNSESWNY